jgi:large subunit ribosomal protein L3
MGKFSHPHRGSLQFLPRQRAGSEIARIRTWVAPEGKQLLGFAGYKAAITQAQLIENNPKSILVNQPRQTAVTVVTVPPLKGIGIRFYNHGNPVGQTLASPPKELGRTIRPLPKEGGKAPEKFDAIRLLVCTQPRLAGFGKKKPEVMEIALAGSAEEQKKTAEAWLGKEIKVSDVLTVGDYLDIFAVTKGRGFLGPISRHGVPLQPPKTKRSRRRPGNIGGWHPKRTLWQVPMSGKTGYNQRCDYNKRVVAITDKLGEESVLIAGSLSGPAKRLIRFRFSVRPPTKIFEPQRLENLAIEEGSEK